jgi:hypothetical protein
MVVERELREAEERYWRALKDNDTGAALRMTDDPCIVAGPQGVGSIDHASFEKMMSAAGWKLVDFELGDMKVRQLSDDVAIVAYKVHETMKVDGKTVELDAADTSTWVRRDGQWVCALHTEALSGDPFGRDRQGSAPSN